MARKRLTLDPIFRPSRVDWRREALKAQDAYVAEAKAHDVTRHRADINSEGRRASDARIRELESDLEAETAARTVAKAALGLRIRELEETVLRQAARIRELEAVSARQTLCEIERSIALGCWPGKPPIDVGPGRSIG